MYDKLYKAKQNAILNGGAIIVMDVLTYEAKVYDHVTSDYDTGRYNQDDLAEKYNINIEAVMWCTQNYGYHNTVAKSGKNPFIDLDLIDKELKPLMGDKKRRK